MIKAIETEYKGYKFRSRLEAKWAVLFDYINLKWEYEPDGFQMRGGTKYLPDFYFPEYGYYAEVKPPRPGMLQELEKAKNLVSESKDKAVVVLGNVPEVENDAWFHVPVICWDGLRRKVVVRWFVLGLENKTAIISDTYTDYLFIRDFENIKEEEWFEPISTRDFEKNFWEAMSDEGYRSRFYIPFGISTEQFKAGDEILEKAYRTARAARFEFGETPDGD